MRTRFDEQLEQLNVLLIDMGALCEEAINYAVGALNEGSEKMRKLTYETDKHIDDREREIENLCLKLLLQQQPVARDLRQISSALKMISDMERIGDQAEDIAEITKSIKKPKEEICGDHISDMTKIAISMVTESVDSFVKKDLEIARAVIKKDDIVDQLFLEVKDDIISAVREDKTPGEYFVDILMIAKYLERISDHAVNVAEWVIFSLTGQHVNEELNNTGLLATGFGTPGEFWEAMKTEKPELLLLDIMLPEEDGISILKKLRSKSDTKDLPVIMLTAKGTEYDKVVGLDTGADDYVAKPFGTMELISRIKALLRRADRRDLHTEYRRGDLYLCPAKHIIRVDGKDITLTLKEFELLCLLFENEGIVLTRDEILTKVWGYEFDGESRTVDVHIRTLRAKLGDAGKCIETVRGLGYKIGGGND